MNYFIQTSILKKEMKPESRSDSLKQTLCNKVEQHLQKQDPKQSETIQILKPNVELKVSRCSVRTKVAIDLS